MGVNPSRGIDFEVIPDCIEQTDLPAPHESCGDVPTQQVGYEVWRQGSQGGAFDLMEIEPDAMEVLGIEHPNRPVISN